MNVYEEAHDLSRAIKDSHEFQEYDRLRKQMEQDESLHTMIRDFERKQLEMQAKQLSGENPSQDMMAQIQSLYAMVSANPGAAAYLQAQARFAVMMKDVYEILTEAIGVSPGSF